MTNTPKITPNRILVATDFSEGSDDALDAAIAQAKRLGARLELLHVIEIAEQFPFGSSPLDLDFEALYAGVGRELACRAERAIAAGVPCETRIAEGGAAIEIAERATEMGAALIVVGTHGRTGLARALLGSVAERVVRRAPCPVLTVPTFTRAA